MQLIYHLGFNIQDSEGSQCFVVVFRCFFSHMALS